MRNNHKNNMAKELLKKDKRAKIVTFKGEKTQIDVTENSNHCHLTGKNRGEGHRT